MNQGRQYRAGTTLSSDIAFAAVTCILVVLAHAMAYLTHEYSHSFVAWALG